MADLSKKLASITVGNTDTSDAAFQALKAEIQKPTINSVEPDDVDDQEALADEVEAIEEIEEALEDDLIEESEVVEEEPILEVVKKVDKKLDPEQQDAVQKRINKLVAQRKSVDEENRVLKAKLESYQAPVPANIPEIVGDTWLIRPDTKQRVEMPRAADYEGNTPLYMEDMYKFNNLKNQVINAVTSHHRQESSKTAYVNQIKDDYLTTKLPAARAKYKDFEAVVISPEQESLEKAHPWIVEALMESEYGTDIVYKLGKHPEYLRELTSMKPANVMKEIGKLEAMEEMTVKPRTVSAAPKPISSAGKLAGTGAASVKTKSFEEMSISQLKERLKTRR
jgi:hypothetical protein